MTQNRVRPGVPTGGQFAATEKAESSVSLTGPSTARERAEQALADAIPAADRDEHASLTAQIEAKQREMRTLQKEIQALADRREAIMTNAVKDATGDQALAALRHGSTAGYARFTEAVRAIHPAMWGSVNYTPMDIPKNTPPYLGPEIYLGSQHFLDQTTPEDLAAAMTEFADRFVTEIPDHGEHPGKIYARVLTASDDHVVIFYRPDGSEATLVRANRSHANHVGNGTLRDVAALVLNGATSDLDQDDDDCDEWDD